MAKINEYPLERFTFGDDDYYDIDYWDGAVYQSAKIKGSTIRAAMSGGGSILAADGQVMPADRSQDLANFKLSLRDGVFTLGTVDADFGSIFQATKDIGNAYATIKTKTNDNAALILDINTADVTGAGNKTAFIQFRDAGVSKYIFGTNTDGVANFSDNSFFISSSAQLTDYIQAIDRNTESFVIGRQIGNPLNDNTKFLINNGNSFNTTELDNVLMLSSRDETKKWSVDKDMFLSQTKIGDDPTQHDDSAILSLNSVDKGLLVPRMTTAQKNGIASPSTSLLVFDNDLNRYEFYDGSAWTPLSVGYGVIEVLRDSDNGIPTFYADLQDALETCKASGSYNTVTLHSNITLTSQIDINSIGTGTGNGYQFNSLLIDGNGFEITFDDSGSTNTFDVNLNHTCNISFINTIINRTSGTGENYALDIDGNGNQSISMSNNYIYSDNGGACFIRDSTGKMFDLGGTRFESDGSIDTLTFRSFNMFFKNFTAVSNGSGDAILNWSNGEITQFYCENTSTGKAYDSNPNAVASFFVAKSNTGVAVDANESSCVVTDFKAISVSGRAFHGFNATNFYLKTGDNTALLAEAYANLKNGYVENNSTSSTMYTNTIEYCHNVTFINYGSSYAAYLNNTVIYNNKITNCTFISEGGIGAFLDTVGVNVYNSTFISRYDNASGHACELDVSGCKLMGCTFIVENSSANGLYSNSALNADVANCNFDNATTAINANITVNASTDEGNGNRSY